MKSTTPRMSFHATVIIFTIGLASGATAQPLQAEPHAIPKTAAPVRVDGVLDEQAWTKAWSAELGYEVQPGENVPAPVRTEVLVTYDDNAVYFAFKAYDPKPGEIRAHLADRDNIGPDDWVAVILDTFNDERRSFDLLVNPLGVQSDFIETATTSEEWDAAWDAAAKITDWGYAVEIRVPFSSLRFQKANGPQVWGFDAVRSYPRSVRHHIATFKRDRNSNCYLCQALKIRGFDGVTPGNDLEITPTVTAVRTDSRADFPNGAMEPGEADGEAGLTARWGITPNLNVVGTLNPDFSQVEADALQLDINEPFALSYIEKRPFFMEGNDFYTTMLNAVYTRTIREPAWGLKLSGKSDGKTFGSFIVSDDTTNLLIPGSQSSDATTLDVPSTAAALRYKHDVGNTLTFGALATSRQGDGYFNHVLGFDANLRLSDKDLVDVQLLGSSTQYPDSIAEEFSQNQGEMHDWAGKVLIERQARNYDVWTVYQEVGKDFRADLGFMPQVDYRKVDVVGLYKWVPEGEDWFTYLEAQAGVRDLEDHAGRLLYHETWLQGQYEGPMQSHALLKFLDRREGYEGHEFEKREVYFHNCMMPFAGGQLWVNLTVGDQIDYTNIRLGERVRFNPGFTQSLGAHLRVDLDATFERMREEGERLFNARIASTTIAYLLSTRSFVRATLQLVDYDFNTALYSDGRDSRTKGLYSQLLYSYKLTPQTVLFLGYSDTSEGVNDEPLTRSDRTFFAKVGYAWMP